MTQTGWRKWHRWVGVVAAPFLLFVAVTGMMLAGTELSSEDEAKRERLRGVNSTVAPPGVPVQWQEPIQLALSSVARQTQDLVVDKLTVEFKGEPPVVVVYTSQRHEPDRPGGEHRKFVCDARSGEVLRVEPYADKSFLHRLHSFEAVGDWGLGLSVVWGFALVGLTLSGMVIYGLMRKPGRRLFW